MQENSKNKILNFWVEKREKKIPILKNRELLKNSCFI